MTQVELSAQPVRALTGDDLGIGGKHAAEVGHASNRPAESRTLPDDHHVLSKVRELLEFYGGILFVGPPGTSKSYFAHQVGLKLVGGDHTRIDFVQFHPSFQYEDFMQGFVPNPTTGVFEMRDKIFVKMARAAMKSAKPFVIVIDEFSRADPGRVFGEALTYTEESKRGFEFTLASGQAFAVPANLYILGTMNPWDRGVDEVDAAFDRRFARIGLDPSRAILEEMLDRQGLPEELAQRVLGWFSLMQNLSKSAPQAAIGQAYFTNVSDVHSLDVLWDHQLKFVVEKAFALDPETKAQAVTGWRGIFRGLRDEDEPSPAEGFGTNAASIAETDGGTSA